MNTFLFWLLAPDVMYTHLWLPLIQITQTSLRLAYLMVASISLSPLNL